MNECNCNLEFSLFLSLEKVGGAGGQRSVASQASNVGQERLCIYMLLICSKLLPSFLYIYFVLLSVVLRPVWPAKNRLLLPGHLTGLPFVRFWPIVLSLFHYLNAILDA